MDVTNLSSEECLQIWGWITEEEEDMSDPHRYSEKVLCDEEGYILAYKYLRRKITTKNIIPLAIPFEQQYMPDPTTHDYSCTYTSPTRHWARWSNNELTADIIPSERNSNGIYCAKHPLSHQLDDYKPKYPANYYYNNVLVELRISGVVVEEQYGYRAEHAEIVREIKY